MDKPQTTQPSAWTWLLAAATSSGSLWLIATSYGETLDHTRLTWGLLLAWVAALFLRSIKDALAPAREDANPMWRAPFSMLLAVAPGLILTWYGQFAPAQPSLARSGVDICEYQVGYCVSGTRAFIFFGGIALLAGIWVAIAILKAAMRSKAN